MISVRERVYSVAEKAYKEYSNADQFRRVLVQDELFNLERQVLRSLGNIKDYTLYRLHNAPHTS